MLGKGQRRNKAYRGTLGFMGTARGYSKVRPPNYVCGFWWTEHRIDRLLYVMRAYNDFEKAARVLAIPVSAVRRQLAFLKSEARFNPDGPHGQKMGKDEFFDGTGVRNEADQ